MSNRTIFKVNYLIGMIVTLITINVFSQGALEPPAPPAPLFKTLEQIESRTIVSNIPYTIFQAGSYYLVRNLTNNTLNSDGITIEANDVSLDLNGYTLYGGKISNISSDDGIFVSGSRTNLHIYNGSIVGWEGDGVNALTASHSIFENLRVSENSGDGLVADFNCLIIQCTASQNGLDGLEGDDGTVIKNCTASGNGDNGIQTSEGCSVLDSASFNNGSDGIDVAAGSVVSRCVATDNGIFGFDIALGGQVIGCVAYDNVSNGFDIASSSIIRDCHSALNNGHGIRTFANAYVVNNKSHENDMDGIRISSTDTQVEGNAVTDNDGTGINVTSSGCLVIRNTAAGNLTNYNISASSSFGPIVNTTGAGNLISIPNANHPLANLEY